MKKIKSLLCIAAAALILAVQAAAAGSWTWDGKPASLEEIAKNTGYDLAYPDGGYKPLYTPSAEKLWNDGLFLGSNGSFDLDEPLTRQQGIAVILRVMGKEKEVLSKDLPCKFPDVQGWAQPYVAYAVETGLTNGISPDRFGGDDAMTAQMFCTFMLRALGYSDKNGEDFEYSKALDKALEVGIIGAPCHAQYTRSNLFLRDNAVVIADNALYSVDMKSGGRLIDGVEIVKPVGSMPTARRADPTPPAATPTPAPAATPTPAPGDSGFTAANAPVTVSRKLGLSGTYSYSSGILIGYTAYYTLKVGNYSGPVDITVTAGGVSATRTITVSAGTSFDITCIFSVRANRDQEIEGPSQRIMTGTDPITGIPRYTIVPGNKTIIPGLEVDNAVRITAGAGSLSDSIRLKGTFTGASVN